MAARHRSPAGQELSTSDILIRRSGASGGYVVNDQHRHMVTIMRSNGMPDHAIADVLGISERTLRSRFKAEMAVGFEMIRSRMGVALVQAGLDGNVSAMKFWLANRCAEWRRANDQVGDVPERDDEVVHFYLPPNHRDEPEDYHEPPTIDGQAEAA